MKEIPPDGEGGAGTYFGNLQIQVGGCYAELENELRCAREIDNGLYSKASGKWHR